MLKRHQDQLFSRLEQCVVTQGWCTIRHEELRLWYGKKITKLVWRDLLERLKETCEETGHDYAEFDFVAYQYDGNILITDKRDLEQLSELGDVAE